MERIGLAASKIAKGNLLLYNLTVIFLALLFALLIFFIAGASIVLALIVIGYVVGGVLSSNMNTGWWQDVVRLCMISLTVVVSIVTLLAILKNLRFKL